MKAFFWLAFGLALLTWVQVQEQRVAIKCIDAGHSWREAAWYELVGRCAAGKPRPRIVLPPMRVEPLIPMLDDPNPLPEL
jgi:hypothetical protein